LYIDGVLAHSSADTSWTADSLADGDYSWYIKAVDLADNARASDQTWSFTVSQPLAIDLTSLTALVYEQRSVVIKWRTEGEQDCQKWAIERSKQADEFYSMVGEVYNQGSGYSIYEYEYKDLTVLDAGVEYYYRLAEYDANGNVSYYGPVAITIPRPYNYSLLPAYPNPSRGQTIFKYQLPKESKVSLAVYNVVGQAIKRFDQGTKPAGYHQISWNDNTLPNGIYFYRLTAGNFSATKKLLIVR
jgi:hypothetical protein